MFGYGKKKEYVKLIGQISRIGSIGGGEAMQKYVILLQDSKEAYISYTFRVGEDVIALTQSGDLVEFITEKEDINVVEGSFVHKTLADLGYKHFGNKYL